MHITLSDHQPIVNRRSRQRRIAYIKKKIVIDLYQKLLNWKETDNISVSIVLYTKLLHQPLYLYI